MFTELTSKPVPGTLAPIFRERPSSGWIRTTSTFGARPSVSSWAKGVCGEEWNWMAASVAFLGGRLAGLVEDGALGVCGEEWNWMAASVAFLGSRLPALM